MVRVKHKSLQQEALIQLLIFDKLLIFENTGYSWQEKNIENKQQEPNMHKLQEDRSQIEDCDFLHIPLKSDYPLFSSFFQFNDCFLNTCDQNPFPLIEWPKKYVLTRDFSFRHTKKGSKNL